jgi:hypothetical protein
LSRKDLLIFCFRGGAGRGGAALSFEKLFRIESEEKKIWFESTDRIVGRQLGRTLLWFEFVLACVCVCVWESERERERE